MSGAERIAVVVVDDDEGMRALLRTTLGVLPRIQIVAEAPDGVEGVKVVVEHAADVVILDVNMPRLDGFGAAELIASVSPRTRIVLHTAEVTPEKSARAEALGLRLLDKARLTDLVDLVGGDAATAGPEGRSAPDKIETIVLLALAERSGEAVLIVSADMTVPYYNKAAADILGLPYPSAPTAVEEVWRRAFGIYDDGSPRPFADRPMGRAFATGRPATDVVVLRVDGAARSLRVIAIPFFAASGEFLGVANYLQPWD